MTFKRLIATWLRTIHSYILSLFVHILGIMLSCFTYELDAPGTGRLITIKTGRQTKIINRDKYNKTILLHMSYELVHPSTQTTRTFSRQFWAKALELAQQHGWQPKGTRPPPHLDFYKLNVEWDGRYLTNDGQTVKAEDALSLAAALERSLDDLSNDNLPMDWGSLFQPEDDLPEWLSPEERECIEEELQDGLLDILGTSPLEYFAGDEKRHLKEFIRFCRLGSFEIQ